MATELKRKLDYDDHLRLLWWKGRGRAPEMEPYVGSNPWGRGGAGPVPRSRPPRPASLQDPVNDAYAPNAQSEIYKKSSIDLAMRNAFRKMRRFLMTTKPTFSI